MVITLPPLSPSAAALDAVLPQLQCRGCGYDGCRPYAEAIARGEAGIDRCPPGGTALPATLARLTGLPLPAHPPAAAWEGGRRLRIDPAACIGCTKCLRVCPVDAIVGAARRMHDILQAECNGCGLCVPPCPVDCIHPEPAPTPDDALRARWRERYSAHQERLAREDAHGPQLEEVPEGIEERRARVLQAIARARAARAPKGGAGPRRP